MLKQAPPRHAPADALPRVVWERAVSFRSSPTSRASTAPPSAACCRLAERSSCSLRTACARVRPTWHLWRRPDCSSRRKLCHSKPCSPLSSTAAASSAAASSVSVASLSVAASSALSRASAFCDDARRLQQALRAAEAANREARSQLEAVLEERALCEQRRLELRKHAAWLQVRREEHEAEEAAAAEQRTQVEAMRRALQLGSARLEHSAGVAERLTQAAAAHREIAAGAERRIGPHSVVRRHFGAGCSAS